jgi:hypothetical protein
LSETLLMLSHARRSTRDSEGIKTQIATTRITNKANMANNFMQPGAPNAEAHWPGAAASDGPIEAN